MARKRRGIRRRRNNNPNTKIREANSRINNVQSELKNIKKKVQVERKINSGYIAQIPRLNLNKWNTQALKLHYQLSLENYLMALLHPELCVQGTLTAKQPSFTPIPTTTVTFKEQFSFKTDSNGEFKLVWIPNFFSNYEKLKYHVDKIAKQSSISADDIAKMISYNYAHLVLYKPAEIGEINRYLFHSSYLPNISLTKYRLVSAKLSVEYVGPKIQKGGMMYSCATYKDLPVSIVGTSKPQGENYLMLNTENILNKLANYNSLFDNENINNGLWNKYVNVSGSGIKLDNIALPTDPTDNTFFPMAHYYANEANTTATFSANNVVRSEGLIDSTDGGHLNYVVSGNGLYGENNSGAPINVFVYYNFEVIAAQETAPFLRTPDNQEKPKLLEILDNNKTKVTNFLVNESQKVNLNPSDSRKSIKNFASNVIREVAKAGFNMVPASSFNMAWAKPFKGISKAF